MATGGMASRSGVSAPSDNPSMQTFRKGIPPTHRPRSRLFREAGGFTLIEIMIVLVIVGILAAIALPSYQRQVAKGRRADALTALSSVLQAQERLRSNTNSYASDIAVLNVASPIHYTISLEGIGNPPSFTGGFTAHAQPISTGLQASDSDCADMSIQVQRGNVVYLASNSAGTDTAKTCWAQ